MVSYKCRGQSSPSSDPPRSRACSWGRSRLLGTWSHETQVFGGSHATAGSLLIFINMQKLAPLNNSHNPNSKIIKRQARQSSGPSEPHFEVYQAIDLTRPKNKFNSQSTSESLVDSKGPNLSQVRKISEKCRPAHKQQAQKRHVFLSHDRAKP